MMLNDGVFLIILLVVVVALGWLLHRLIKCTNALEWADLIATRGKLNSYKVGFWIGAIVGSWVVIKQTYMGQLDGAVFGIYMGFLTGAPVAMAAIGSRGTATQTRKVDNPD